MTTIYFSLFFLRPSSGPCSSHSWPDEKSDFQENRIDANEKCIVEKQKYLEEKITLFPNVDKISLMVSENTK